ncbi:MAG: asparaginase, partial [Leuconostoc sp.]|nr:asparaginase [Leuconostoc sp.]
AEPVYSYEGGGVELEKMGIIFCKTINSQKARLKLLIGQHANLTPQAFKQFMES